MKFAIAILTTFLLSGAVISQNGPTAQDIITSVIQKQEQDKKHCAKYSYAARTNKIKYDKEMIPEDSTITMRQVYRWGDSTSEEITSIYEDGKYLTAEKIEEKVADLNKKWLDDQKDRQKKEGSKDNFVDPLTEDGLSQYDYYLTGKGDSAFAVIPSKISTPQGAVDQSVEKLMSFVVITARSKTEDSRHLNATYWIDSKTYGVLRTTFQPAKLPHFVDLLDFNMDYGVVKDGDSTLYLPRRFELKGKAGFLFFKGRFGVVETYTDYQCDSTIPDSLFAHRYFYSGETREE